MTSSLEHFYSAPPTLKEINLELVPFTQDFLTDRYISWFNDPVVCRYNRHGSSDYTRDKANIFYSAVKANPALRLFAVIWLDGRVHIGNASISDISKENRSAELAIILGEKQFWGRGAGYHIFKLLSDYSFNELDLHRLRFGFFAENIAMRKIAQKLGYTKEGLFQDAVFKNGCYYDIEQWARINPRHKASSRPLAE